MGIDRLKLPPELQKRLQSEIAPGERLLYAGQPDWRAELATHVVVFIFAVFWSFIALLFFGMSGASLLGLVPMVNNGKPTGIGLELFFFFFSMPFVAIGLAMLASPFLGMRKARRTVHAVTDARLINFSADGHGNIESFKLDTINFIKRRDRKNGTGSLSIGYGVEKDSDGDTRPLTTDWTGIPNARRAEQLIREQARWVR